MGFFMQTQLFDPFRFLEDLGVRVWLTPAGPRPRSVMKLVAHGVIRVRDGRLVRG